MAGLITFEAISGSPTSGCILTVTYNRPYAAAPKAVILSQATSAVFFGAYVDYTTSGSSQFLIKMTNPPGVGVTLAWYYIVIE